MELRTFDQLIKFLRNWGSSGQADYDIVGMLHLVGACADSLADQATDSDLNRAQECLTQRQIDFLIKLGTRLTGLIKK